MEQKIDSTIRFLMLFMLLMIPFSSATIEVTVGLSCFLWLVKRILRIFHSDGSIFSRTSLAFKLPDTPLNTAMGFFCLIALLSALGSFLIGKSIHGYFSKLLEWFVIYFLFVEVFNQRKHFRFALNILCVSTVILLFDSFWQLFTGIDLIDQSILEQGRVNAVFRTPIGLSSYIGLIFPIFLSMLFILFNDKKKFLLFLIIFVCLAAVLLFTETRAAILAVSVGLLFFYFVMFVKKKDFGVLYSFFCSF